MGLPYYCEKPGKVLKSILPNILTLVNLACGVLAINAIYQEDMVLVAYLVGFSLLADFLDGLVARLLGVHSEIGKQLDSLADVVSFGVSPGIFLGYLFREAAESQSEPIPDFLPYLAFLLPLFAALRLAKFNVDTRQEDYFIGLPTPAMTLLVYALGFWALWSSNPVTASIILHPFLLTLLAVGGSLLLVAELPLLSLKIKEWTWRANKGQIILLLSALALLLVFRMRALAFLIPLYVLLSLFFKPRR